jgi:hypothetical protein
VYERNQTAERAESRCKKVFLKIFHENCFSQKIMKSTEFKFWFKLTTIMSTAMDVSALTSSHLAHSLPPPSLSSMLQERERELNELRAVQQKQTESAVQVCIILSFFSNVIFRFRN